MSKGREPWNKGFYNKDIIDQVNMVINGCPTPLTIGEIYAFLVGVGKTQHSYKMFLWHLAKARGTGAVDGNRILDGRGRKRYKGGGVRNNFKLGDKVRINRDNKRVPEWIRAGLRLDTPRTIVAVFNVPREIGYVPKTRHTLYSLGDNKRKGTGLEYFSFRAGELVPFVKNGVGRPRLKRHYNQRQLEIMGGG